MKLICLNLWGGRAFDPLMDFIAKFSGDTDVFCFQEVFESSSGIVEYDGTRVNLLADLKAALGGFNLFLAPIGGGYALSGPVDWDVEESNAIFIKKGAVPAIDSRGIVFAKGEYKTLNKNESFEDVPANFQYIRFSKGGKRFTVCNFHGTSTPGDKKDTPERLRQSQIIREFLDKESGAKIICGDFNLLPDTESIKLLEENMENLVKKFKIKRTRSRLSPWFDKKDFQKFADYVFVSPEVEVRRFEAPDIDVSDHLPLVLEFS